MPIQQPWEVGKGMTVNLLARTLVIGASVVSIGFGIWHFFVPKLWNWYSYIDSKGAELVIAVRAINVFFSLSLVLFGMVNILLIYANQSNRYSIAVVLAATTILWLARVVFQLIYPQGSISPMLQYGMLLTFILLTLCYVISLYFVIWR
jgi:uncharacterized membrane protein YecN with MAPEG domain